MKQRKTNPSAQEIANLAGVSLTLVNRKLSQGRSPRQIIAEAELQAQQVAQKHPVVNVTSLVNGHAAGTALNYSQAQASKESWLARLRELDYQERSRELLPLSYVKLWGSRFLVEGRDILQNAPNELRDVLAAESNPLKVAEILQRWVDRCMQKFFELESLWGGDSPLEEGVLRERFNAARLSVVRGEKKPSR